MPNPPARSGVRIRRQRGYICEPAKPRQKSAKPRQKSAHRLVHVLAADRGLDRNPAAGRAPRRRRHLLHGVAAGLHERLLLHRHAQHLRRGTVRARRLSRSVCRVRRRRSLDYQYRRHRRDRRGVLSHQAAVCVAGTQACPASSVTHLSTSQQVVGDIHLVFAATTFIALGLMALRFAKGGITPFGQSALGQIRYGLGFGQPSAGDQPQRFRGENVIYRASGITILSCVILAALSNLLPAAVNAHWPLLFTFEAVAVVAFGVSWFVKGRTIHGLRARIRKGAPAARPVTGLPAVHAEDHARQSAGRVIVIDSSIPGC